MTSSTKAAAPRIDGPSTSSSCVRSRRAAHWVQTVSRPPDEHGVAQLDERAASAARTASARPGTAIQLASPVSQRDTSTPLATAVAATVKACERRSGASVPAVTLTTRERAGCPWDQATIGRMFNLDQDIPEPLRPLAWLIGRWEGAGVVGYPTIESAHFGQEIEVTHDGRGFLKWESRAWILDSENGAKVRPAAVESGFWRPLENGEVELLLAHPTGILELYYGTIEPAKIQLKTDSVLRPPGRRSTTPRRGCTASSSPS